jgi:hypothetical protein
MTQTLSEKLLNTWNDTFPPLNLFNFKMLKYGTTVPNVMDEQMISEVDIRDMRPETTRGSVLNEANSVVNGARADTYGGPEDSFNRIAALWNAYGNLALTAVDVAVMMGLLKVARLKNSPAHRDSWVDLAGYAACGAEAAGIK